MQILGTVLAVGTLTTIKAELISSLTVTYCNCYRGNVAGFFRSELWIQHRSTSQDTHAFEVVRSLKLGV